MKWLDRLRGRSTMLDRCVSVVVASGKGGVGKSFVASQLALRLSATHKVAAIDLDIDMPNLLRYLGAHGVKASPTTELTLDPYHVNGRLQVFSPEMLTLDDNAAIMVSGEGARDFVNRCITEIGWDSDTEIMIWDFAPGVEESFRQLKMLTGTTKKPMNMLVLTTPEPASVDNAARLLNDIMVDRVKVNMLGVIENRSHMLTDCHMKPPVCPDCGEVYELYRSGGYQKLVDEFGVRHLGSIPALPSITTITNDPEDDTVISCDVLDDIVLKIKEGF